MKNNVAVKMADLEPANQQRTMQGPAICWRRAGEKGVGIYAMVDFKAGEVIETSPVTVVPKAETDLFDDEAKTSVVSIIDQYLFVWRGDDVKGEEYCMGHGYLMLYNYSPAANGVIRHDFDQKTISMVAGRDIQAGEEITFDYGFDDEFKPWFDVQS